MSNSACFSVVSVTLNNLDELQKTHESLQKQNSQNFEWIVIDGGSEDGTTDFPGSTNAQWISEKDSGIYDAMNKGIERAHGNYILLLNAGDDKNFRAPNISAEIQ